MNREDKFTYIPWEFANPKKRWRLKTQKTLDDFTAVTAGKPVLVSSDFLETTKRGVPLQVNSSHSVQ